MSALDVDIDLFLLFIDRLLGPEDGRCRLEMRAQHDRITVTDAAENTTGMIGLFGHIVIDNGKGIVVFTSLFLGTGKSVADLKGLNGSDGHDSLREAGIQFVKNRFADTGGNIFDETFYNAACRIGFLPISKHLLYNLLLHPA